MTEIRPLGWADLLFPWGRWRDFGVLHRERGRAIRERDAAQLETIRLRNEMDRFVVEAQAVLLKRSRG